MSYQNYPVQEPKHLRDLVRTAAILYGDRVAIREKSGPENTVCSYSSSTLWKEIRSLTAALTEKGLAGQKIVILGESSYAWVLAFFTVAGGLGVAVTVDPEVSAEQLSLILAKSGATHILCSPDHKKVAAAAAKKQPTPPTVTSFAQFRALCAADAKLNRLRKITPTDPAAILFFSDGNKGVVLSHRNLCFDIASVRRMIRINPEDVFLSILPLYHAYELTCGLLCPLSAGASVVFSQGLRSLSREMREFHPTVLNCIPFLAETMYQKIWENIHRHGLDSNIKARIRMTNAIKPERAAILAKKSSFSSIHKSFGGKLRLILTGGAPIAPHVLHGFRDFGILAIQSYTLAECAPVAAINRDKCYRDDAAGMVMPDSVIDIYDMQDNGIGEIRYRGPNLMLGYCGDPELTDAVLRDGWFYTGDLGFLDNDGFLHVIGRKKNQIVTASGRCIFPEELEALLCSNKFIQEAVVCGRFDEKKQDVVLSAILCPNMPAIRALEDMNTRQRMQVEMRRAIAEINALLPAHQQIASFTVRSQPLPRNAIGQILRDTLSGGGQALSQ